jgi:hypothetical protein
LSHDKWWKMERVEGGDEQMWCGGLCVGCLCECVLGPLEAVSQRPSHFSPSIDYFYCLKNKSFFLSWNQLFLISSFQ